MAVVVVVVVFVDFYHTPTKQHFKDISIIIISAAITHRSSANGYDRPRVGRFPENDTTRLASLPVRLAVELNQFIT